MAMDYKVISKMRDCYIVGAQRVKVLKSVRYGFHPSDLLGSSVAAIVNPVMDFRVP
jgi:hypothetical protein